MLVSCAIHRWHYVNGFGRKMEKAVSSELDGGDEFGGGRTRGSDVAVNTYMS